MEKSYSIRLDDTSNKLKLIKIYKDITNTSLTEAKELIDNTPPFGTIFDFLTLDEANTIANKFQVENCKVTVYTNSMEIFSNNNLSSSDHSYDQINISSISNKDLISILKRTKAVILKADQLQNEIESAEEAVKLIKNESASKESQFGKATFIGLIVGIILGSVILPYIGSIIGLIIGGIIGSKINQKRNGEKYLEQAQKYYNENYPKAEERRNRLNDMAIKLFNSDAFIEAQEVIPSDYFDIDSVDYLLKMIENLRADTLKEAINIYEDYLYKCRMEEMQKQQLILSKETAESQKQASEAAQQIASTSMQTAKYAKATTKATRLNTFVNIIKK